MTRFSDDKHDFPEPEAAAFEDLELDLDLLNDDACQEHRLREFENLVADIVTWIKADRMWITPAASRERKTLPC
ncbi:MAG: hypothetical protein AB1896_12265 [Thermodesulfobacteriota bacterium]